MVMDNLSTFMRKTYHWWTWLSRNCIINAMADVDVSTLSPSDESAWQAYVNSHPDATIYHTLEWRDILYSEYRFEPVYLVAKEDDRVVGILPLFFVRNLMGKRLISLPFSIYGGPIGETEAVNALMNECIEMIRKERADSLETKSYNPAKAVDPGSVEWGVGVAVDLMPVIDVLWKGLTDRNDVNRAIKEGLKFSLSDGEGLERFYKLQLMTRKRLGLPTPSLRYYNSFFGKMPNMVKLALVEKGGILIAGGVFFAYKDSVLYALGASDHRYLNCKPNDLLIWETMKWAAGEGFKRFDLGPTASTDKGLLDFKKKWGGMETESVRYYFPDIPKGPQMRKGSLLFNMMPIRISSVIGHHVLRYLG